MCLLSCVMCCMSPVTYHLSLTTTVTYPPPAYSFNMHNRLVCKDPKPPKINQNAKNPPNLLEIKPSTSYLILAIRSLTRGLQSIAKLGFQEEATYDRQTRQYID